MKRALYYVVAGLLWLPMAPTAQAQDFAAVLEAIQTFEARVNQLIESEAGQRQSQIAAIRKEVKTLATNLPDATSSAAQYNYRDLETQVHSLQQSLDQINQELTGQIALLKQEVQQSAGSAATKTSDTAPQEILALLGELQSTVESQLQARAVVPQPDPIAPWIRKLTVNGQIRLREELNGKDFTPGADVNELGLLRSRLGLTFQPSPQVSAFLQFQDSRTFGREGGTTLSNGTNLDLHQGYLRLDDFFGAPGLSLQVGRMEINYGGQRLVGAVGWHNVGRSFDGGKITFVRPKVRIETWAAKLAETFFEGENQDKSVGGLDLAFSPAPAFKPRAYFIWEADKGRTSAGDQLLSRKTVGLHVTGVSGVLDYDVETALQTGLQAGADIEAFMVGLTAGVTFPTPRKPRIAVGYDHLSGNDGTAGTVKVFNTLYATNHKFYGFMDYFLNIPVHTQGFGLRDFMVKAKTRLAPQWVGSVDFHTFRYTEKDAFGDTQLGKEWDFILNYQYSQPMTVTLGASVFLPDKVFKRLKGDTTTYWGFSMLTLNF